MIKVPRACAKRNVSYEEHDDDDSNDDEFLELDDETIEAESEFGTFYFLMVNFYRFLAFFNIFNLIQNLDLFF